LRSASSLIAASSRSASWKVFSAEWTWLRGTAANTKSAAKRPARSHAGIFTPPEPALGAAGRAGNVVALCDGSERADRSIGERRHSRQIRAVGGAFDRGPSELRAVVRVGHHHHSLAARGVKDQIPLIADILAALHEHEGGALAGDRGAEAVRPAVLGRQHL